VDGGPQLPSRLRRRRRRLPGDLAPAGGAPGRHPRRRAARRMARHDGPARGARPAATGRSRRPRRGSRPPPGHDVGRTPARGRGAAHRTGSSAVARVRAAIRPMPAGVAGTSDRSSPHLCRSGHGTGHARRQSRTDPRSLPGRAAGGAGRLTFERGDDPMNPYPSNEDLAAALSTLLAKAEPVPAEVLAAASEGLAWRDPDAARALLVAESTGVGAELSAVRGEPPRLLTFEVDGVTIDLEVTLAGRRVRLVGQMAPMRAGRVSIAHANGTSDTTAD